MVVSTTRNVILCHGRSHQQKNARFVEAIWSKKEIRLSAVRQLAVMWSKSLKKTKYMNFLKMRTKSKKI